MQFNEYQQQTNAIAVYPRTSPHLYVALGLCGEVGEIAEKVKKHYRDGTIDLDALRLEVGDALWYLSQLCNEYGISLDGAAQDNLRKLASRKDRGQLRGSGDNR